MSHSFAITTTTNNLAIMAGERQSVSFTVSNISRVAVRGRVAVVPQGATPAGWFALIGEAERDFVPAENEQFTYEIVVPPETPSGRHLFSARIVNVDIDKIEEDFADSPVVALDVTAVAKPKKFPWWIVAVIAAVVLLVVIAVTAFVLTRKPAVVASIAAVPDPVTAGMRLGYTVTVSNTGSATAHDVVFTDTLPAGVTLVEADERCTITEMGGQVVCPIGELPRDETLDYALMVAVDGSARSEIENQVALATDRTNPEEGAAIYRALTSLTVETALRLELQASATTTTVGEAVVLMVVVHHTGPSDATGIVLTYAIPAGTTLSNLPESCEETPAGQLVCTLGSLSQQREASLSFSLTPGPGSVGTVENQVSLSSTETTTETAVLALTVEAAGSVTQPITASTLDQIARLASANMSGDVFAVGYSDPAGLHRLAVGSGTTIQIWQFGPELALVCTLNSAETITSLDISAGGNWLASGGADGEVRIWDIDTCTTSREFVYSGSERVDHIAFLNEAELLVVTPFEDAARIYALDDGIYASPREVELGVDIPDVLHTPNGKLLGEIGSTNLGLNLIDLATGAFVGTLSEDPWYYPTFTFSNNSEFVALVHGENLELLRLDAITAPEEYTAEKVWVAPFSGDWTTVLAFSPTDELLAAIVRNQLEWRRAVDGSLLVTTNIGPFGWKWLAFSADGTYLVLAADDGVEIWGIPKR